MRIVHVTTVHPRYDVRIFHKECTSLAAAGYETFLIVGDGRGDELRDGVQLIDIGAPSGGRLARMRTQPQRVFEAVRRLQPSVVHFHDPELLPVGVRLASSGVSAVYDAHEDLPRQILGKDWIPAATRKPLAWAVERYENFAVRRLSGVVAATPHIAKRFARHQRRTTAVCNFPVLAELSIQGFAGVREDAVCYVGSITANRGVRELVQALEYVPGVRLIMCGEFEDAAFEAELRARPGWAHVEYLGQVDRGKVRDVMARSRAGLVTLRPTPAYMDSLPIKMFEYMSAGLPVIASNFPLWQEIVIGQQCGVCVDPTDPRAIALAIRRLLDAPWAAERMGRAGRIATERHYSWSHQERQLLDFYLALVAQTIGRQAQAPHRHVICSTIPRR